LEAPPLLQEYMYRLIKFPTIITQLYNLISISIYLGDQGKSSEAHFHNMLWYRTPPSFLPAKLDLILKQQDT
jgi:hypothetical protein